MNHHLTTDPAVDLGSAADSGYHIPVLSSHDRSRLMPDLDSIQQPADLDQLDRDGLIAFLNSGRDDTVDLWNAWREANKRPPLDLRGAALRNVELPRIDFRWCDLREVDFFDAYLQLAHFYEADLRGALLDGADLYGASFRKANLDGADLDSAIVRSVDLYEASLCDANLGEADLRKANLVRAKLCGADLRWANLAHANLRWANLRDVALSASGSLRDIDLYETNLSDLLSLRYEQLLGDNHQTSGPRRHFLRITNRLYESSISEETKGRFAEAMEVFAALKGYFEDAGDYEASNWAYIREKVMKKMLRVPRLFRWLYPRWRKTPDYQFQPDLYEWLALEFSEKIANYGNSLIRPTIWLLITIGIFALVYWRGGMLTTDPACAYVERTLAPHPGCAPTTSLLDALLFSLAAMSTIEIGAVQPFVANVGLLTSLEALVGITLTGLLGFVLGNKLRFS